MNLIIRSQFGHEIFGLWVAKAYGLTVVIVPNKDDETEYNSEAEKIFNNMSSFYSKMEIAPFADRANALESGWDIVKNITSGSLNDSIWAEIANISLSLEDKTSSLPDYHIGGEKKVLFVPQKLISDGLCGVTASQQSLTPEIFDFLKEDSRVKLVLGQHFHKVNDLEKVQAISNAFEAYVPGMTENEEVFGIRGVQHKMYYHLYEQLDASVGIAGTHTWIMLALFPELPQVILFNKNGCEHWPAIAKAMQEAGRKVICIGFDENSDMESLKKDIKTAYHKLF